MPYGPQGTCSPPAVETIGVLGELGPWERAWVTRASDGSRPMFVLVRPTGSEDYSLSYGSPGPNSPCSSGFTFHGVWCSLGDGCP
jgi:hypothetical protein